MKLNNMIQCICLVFYTALKVRSFNLFLIRLICDLIVHGIGRMQNILSTHYYLITVRIILFCSRINNLMRHTVFRSKSIHFVFSLSYGCNIF